MDGLCFSTPPKARDITGVNPVTSDGLGYAAPPAE